MKKFTLVAALMVLLCGTALSAKNFDWSKSWCNYGAGIEKGDFLVNVDAGLFWTDVATAAAWNSGYSKSWMIPPVMVEVQYATPIWKLPFTFGGYAGVHGVGYKYDFDGYYTHEHYKRHKVCISFGAEAAYHAMLPIEKLDVYAMIRLGGAVPISNMTLSFADFVEPGFSIGANYFFTDKIGANLEFGAPFSKIGLTLKF